MARCGMPELSPRNLPSESSQPARCEPESRDLPRPCEAISSARPILRRLPAKWQGGVRLSSHSPKRQSGVQSRVVGHHPPPDGWWWSFLHNLSRRDALLCCGCLRHRPLGERRCDSAMLSRPPIRRPDYGTTSRSRQTWHREPRRGGIPCPTWPSPDGTRPWAWTGRKGRRGSGRP